MYKNEAELLSKYYLIYYSDRDDPGTQLGPRKYFLRFLLSRLEDFAQRFRYPPSLQTDTRPFWVLFHFLPCIRECSGGKIQKS